MTKPCNREKQDKQSQFSSSFDPRTPHVLMDLMWPYKEKMDTFLEIDFEFVRKSDEPLEMDHYSRAPWEVEVHPDSKKGGRVLLKKDTQRPSIQNLGTGDRKKQAKWLKYAQFPSMLPDRLLYKFESQD